MKKLVISLIGIFMIIALCSGCEADITRGIRHAGFNVTENRFVCSAFISSDNNYTNKIKYLGDSFAIDNDGIIYELSLNQVYSNQQNCRKSPLNTTVAAIMDERIIKGIDGKLYYLVANNGTEAYGEVTASDSAYQIYQLLFADTEVLKIMTINQNEGIYYVLKTDGNIYKYIILRNDTQSPYTIISREVIFSKETFGNIIDFNYSNSSKATSYIRSDDYLYRWAINNLEECSKYADKECTYARYRDDALMEYEANIIGFNGNLLITDYGREFTAAR